MRAIRSTAAVSTGALLVLGLGSAAGAIAASASTLTCVPQASIVQGAPAVLGSTGVTANTMGSYVVNRTAATTLAISGTPVANTGWLAGVSTATGTKVRVTYHSTTSTQLDRFTTSLSTSGLKLITHVVTCS